MKFPSNPDAFGYRRWERDSEQVNVERKLIWVKIEVMEKSQNGEFSSTGFPLWWCRPLCKDQGFVLSLRGRDSEGALKIAMMQKEWNDWSQRL